MNDLKAMLASRAARNRIIAAIVITVLVVFGGVPAWIFTAAVLIVWAIAERRELARALGLVAALPWLRVLVRANEAQTSRLMDLDASLSERGVANVVYRLAALIWAALCLGYVFSARPPYEFFADIGGYISALGRMGAVATSPQSLLAMIGWQTWNDAPKFVLFPNVTLFAALPFELILRDPFRTIKLVQALQLTVAFAGAAWLYTQLFGKSRLCWLAGWIYAAMPFCTLAVRGELDFGSIFAAIPLALAVNVALARRYGARALPLAALVCSIVGSAAPYTEYLLTVGVPLFLTTLVLFRHEAVRLRWYSLCAAAAAFALLPAFVVLPTLFGPHPLWFSDAYLAGLKNRTQLPHFSQGFLEQIAGVSRESLLSDNPLLNASRSLPFALVSGGVAWLLLGFAALRSMLAGSRWWWPIAVVAFVWTVVSFGPSVPLVGGLVWNLLAALPVLEALRTPDRFAQFDGILVALAATYGISLLARSGTRWITGVTALGVLLVAGYLVFDLNESVLGFGTMDRQLPNQSDVSKAARAIGGRSAVLAFSKDGSLRDLPPYAPLNPTVAFAWDFAARYSDTDGGVGLLRRAAVRSIVTSPVWTSTTENGMPADMSAIVAQSSLVTALPPFPKPFIYVAAGEALPISARVFAVKAPREMLASVLPLCTYAGPAAFALTAGDTRFDAFALIHGAHVGCGATLRADYDAMDEAVPAAAVEVWSGAAAFGQVTQVPPSALFDIDRLALTAPWYRHSFAGDSILSAQPFVADGPATSRNVPFTIAQPGRYAAYVRTAGIGVLSAIGARGEIVTAGSERNTGFHWLRLPLGELKAGSHTLLLQVRRPSQPTGPLVIDEVALARDTVVVPAATKTDGVLLSSRSFAPPLRQADREPDSIFPRLQYGVSTSLGQGAEIDGQTTVGSFGGTPEIRSAAASTRIRFRWSGATGRYVGGVAAWLVGGGSTLAVTAGGKAFSAAYDASLGIVPTSAYGILDLRHGEPIDVVMTSPNASPDSPNALLDLRFVGVRSQEVPTDYDRNGETWRFDSGNWVAFFEALRGSQLTVRSDSLVAPQDSMGIVHFQPDFDRGRVKARIDSAGSLGRVSLTCGGVEATADVGTATINPDGADVSLIRRDRSPCTLRVWWESHDLAIRRVRVRAEGGSPVGWTASQYFAAGTYEWAARKANAVNLTIDGASWAPGKALRLAAGTHQLVLARTPAEIPSIFIHNVASWTTALSGKPTTELAELNDGYWSAQAGDGGRVAGYPCDLVNTCFDGTSPKGAARHALPPPLAWGFILTAFDVIACLALLGIRTKRKVEHDG